MKHARDDYNRFQDPLPPGNPHRIPDDEPVFLIRGQDASGPAALRAWAELNDVNGGEAEASAKAREWAVRMLEWQAQHGSHPADL
jgi:hypothetical protein